MGGSIEVRSSRPGPVKLGTPASEDPSPPSPRPWPTSPQGSHPPGPDTTYCPSATLVMTPFPQMPHLAFASTQATLRVPCTTTQTKEVHPLRTCPEDWPTEDWRARALFAGLAQDTQVILAGSTPGSHHQVCLGSQVTP